MKMTKKIVNVVGAAFSMGYEVKNCPTKIEITSPIKGRPGITITEDGNAYRNDVSLELASTIRTAKQMIDVLISGTSYEVY